MPTLSLVQYVMEIWGAIFCLIMFMSTVITQSAKYSRFKMLPMLLLLNMGLLIMDAIAWRFRGYPGAVGFWMVRISNWSVFALLPLMYYVYFRQIEQLLGAKGQTVGRGWKVAMLAILAAIQLLLLISQPTNLLYYFDETNTYHRTGYFALHYMLSYLSIILLGALLWKKRTYLNRVDWICLILLPSIAVVLGLVQLMVYGLSLVQIGTTSVVLLTYLVDMAEQSRRVAQQERELQEAKLALLRSQMQPHFMFNSLNTIRTLTLINPPEAANAVTDFADFVRASLDTMDSVRLIDVQQELTLTDKYLAMEKRRFGDYITVETDVQDTAFSVPAFTIQPMVENAIRHGLCKKVTPGTVFISTRLEGDHHVIEIRDDGVGFDSAAKLSDDRPHVGVANVRRRLMMLCQGTLDIASRPGEGTTVTIRIPG